MNKQIFEMQLQDTLHHYEQFVKTQHLYHLLAMGDLVRWLKQELKLTDNDIIDMRSDLVAFYEDYENATPVDQLNDVLNCYKNPERLATVGIMSTENVSDFMDSSKAAEFSGLSKAIRARNNRLKYNKRKPHEPN